jgi:plastocyanin
VIEGGEKMKTIFKPGLLALATIILIITVSCGSSLTTTATTPITTLPTISPTVTAPVTSTATATMPADNVEIKIENYEYAPASVTISPGTTVTWVNKDSVQHTVTERNGVFDSGLFSLNKTFSYVFTNPGEYEYYCIPHPYMTGKVIVK